MGPVTLFDKSFLQSLSLDESVWFDHFFQTNVCPMFYLETLADLDKSVRPGRTSEQEVRIIADKFPEMRGSPSSRHTHLSVGDLLGDSVPMTGQIPLAGGRFVKSGGKRGVVYEKSPEAEAFGRWKRHQFTEMEQGYAQLWRRALLNLDQGGVGEAIEALASSETCSRTLVEAKSVAESIVSSNEKGQEVMHLVLLFLNVPAPAQIRILQRWSLTGCPPLVKFAPYAAHVLAVEVFFQVAMSAGLISGDRSSSRVDISYLYYLPFCTIFVSSDRLHQKCAPLFLRSEQEFVWGPELKEGLGQVDTHYSQLPRAIKDKGIMFFAGDPPKEETFLVTRLWDRHFAGWREMNDETPTHETTDDGRLVSEINQMADAPALSPTEIDFDVTEADAIALTHAVRKKKGSWYQIPKDL